MKFLSLPLILLSFSLFSGYTVFEDGLDEFTDEREIFVALVGDNHKSYSSELIGVYCDTDYYINMKLLNGFIANSDPVQSVTLRFDKNEPVKTDFLFVPSRNTLVTTNTPFISSFLNELRNSNSLIVKIEGVDEIMRFTDLYDSEKHVADFINAASEMPASTCDIYYQ